MTSFLTASEVAREFDRVTWQRFESAAELVDAIEKYMASRLPGSKISVYDVAYWVMDLRKPAQLPTPEENLADLDLQEGISDPAARDLAFRKADSLALAQRVRDMDHQQFSAAREELGLSRSTFAFLAGE